MGERNKYRWIQCPCTCASAVVTRYQTRISNPILERIDIHIEVPLVDYEKLSVDRMGGEASPEFDLPWGWNEKRIMLRFGSVNYLAEVWLNNRMHEGGHLPFELVEAQQQFQWTIRLHGLIDIDTSRHQRNIAADAVKIQSMPGDKRHLILKCRQPHRVTMFLQFHAKGYIRLGIAPAARG